MSTFQKNENGTINNTNSLTSVIVCVKNWLDPANQRTGSEKVSAKWKDFLLAKRMVNLSVHSLLRCFYLLDGKCLSAVFRNSCLQNLNIPRCVARVPSIRHCCIVTFLPCSPLPCLSANPPKRSHLFSSIRKKTCFKAFDVWKVLDELILCFYLFYSGQ